MGVFVSGLSLRHRCQLKVNESRDRFSKFAGL